MYGLIFSRTAEKQLKKLPRKDQERINAVLDRARIRPEAHFERMVGEPIYKLRAGDYRIIADIQHERIEIHIIEIGDRKNDYQTYARKR
jgi:mRNA interferase RelE/StbE